MAEREPGFYRVNLRWAPDRTEWTLAKWTGEGWWAIGINERLDEGQFTEIGECVEQQPETIHAALRAALLKAQAALNPLSGFLRRGTPKMERYLESVREEIRAVLSTEEIAGQGWPEPQPITDAQKTGEEFLLWDPKWKSWDKGSWSAKSGTLKGRWSFPQDYAEENEITHYLPLPPDVKP